MSLGKTSGEAEAQGLGAGPGGCGGRSIQWAEGGTDFKSPEKTGERGFRREMGCKRLARQGLDHGSWAVLGVEEWAWKGRGWHERAGLGGVSVGGRGLWKSRALEGADC